MRGSRLAATVVCGLVAVLLSGCGNPGGVDGALTDEWAPVAEPKPFIPPASACYQAGYTEFATLDGFDPVECAEKHRAETIHLGTFADADAELKAPPARGSAALRRAYAECDKQAKTFLGADFRYGRLWLGVVVPSAAGWSGGTRWFRCDLFEVANVEDFDDAVDREGSLKGALTAATAPLRLGCYQTSAASSGAIEKMAAIACTKQHNSEFVGVYTAPQKMAYPDKDSEWQRLHTGCRAVVAAYAKVPNDEDLPFRTGTVVVPNLEDDWNAGNHGVRCYLYLKDAKFTRSMKGAGDKGLPAR